MLRRLLLGYLGLLLVALAAFGVPFGILWSSHARSDELSALQQSAHEAARAVSGPIEQAVGNLGPAHVVASDRDRDGDGLLSRFVLAPTEQVAVSDALSDFASGSRSLAAVVRVDGQVVAARGASKVFAGAVLSRHALRTTLGQSSGEAEGQTTIGRTAVLFASAPVLVPVIDPVEPGSRLALHDSPGVPVAAVVVAEPAGVLAGRVRTIAVSLAALGAAILFLAALAGWALVRSLVRPLKKIELAVAELGRGELSARAPTDEGPPELAELAETVNVMATQLGELISAQRAFVADASHQLRTPLTALRLRLEGLAAGEPTPPEELRAILAEVERLSRLVTGLLGLARAEELPSRPEVTDVAGLLAARGEAWQGVAEEQGIALAAAGRAPAYALVVPEDLEQAIDNLLDNALRVAPPGSTVHLHVDADEAGWVTIHVTDQGPGMPPEDRLHAFDRFWTRKADRAGGSGLGLAIVDRLVRNSGGEVELLDGPGGSGIDAVLHLQPA